MTERSSSKPSPESTGVPLTGVEVTALLHQIAQKIERALDTAEKAVTGPLQQPSKKTE